MTGSYEDRHQSANTAVDWLLTQSQAQRGREIPFRSTSPTFADWVLKCIGAASAAAVDLVLRVAYPEPTPVTVQLGFNFKRGPIANSVTPKLFGYPSLIGTVPPLYSTLVGTWVVEWVCAGATYSCLLDLGPQCIALPACDQVTVSFFSFALTAPDADRFVVACSVLPVAMPGSVGTLTRQPVIVDPGVPVFSPFRQAWARRWKVTAAIEPLGSAPAPIGPIVVDVIDSFSLADSAESVEFTSVVPSSAISAFNQGWIECSGPALGYAFHNNGGPDSVKIKLCEQIQVA